jgi:hypothetical protein
MRRTSRRYLRGAVETTHDFQEFLDENPAVAQGLASVGSLLLNAMMQSKYGPTIQGLLNPGAAPAASAAAPASPKAAPAKPAAARPKAKSKAKSKAKPKAKIARRPAKKASKKK